MTKRDRTFVQVQIDPEKKSRFAEKLEKEGKKITDIVNEWIDDYIDGSEKVDVVELKGDVIELRQRLVNLEQSLQNREGELQGESAA
ncbi:MAG: hypothetical protein HWQ38_37765 [Nostoc sp. NMS7]|uniref:plasmid partition protein ParG n=1 Tax=Nostoc sp. NMS7 TaxID=2815391 RepID=UPI0025D57061|nr:plasmid partition protein ParG [Nostoc sp. NMS7]MBN3951905.1 hypothetical protein [Nostoc sp. NMS7]